jgi:phosphotransferase system enzyme I (PtsP)
MGFDVLSMNATSLPRVKKAVRSVTRAEARELLAAVRSLDHSAAVRQHLQDTLSERGLGQFIHAPPE